MSAPSPAVAQMKATLRYLGKWLAFYLVLFVLAVAKWSYDANNRPAATPAIPQATRDHKDSG